MRPSDSKHVKTPAIAINSTLNTTIDFGEITVCMFAPRMHAGAKSPKKDWISSVATTTQFVNLHYWIENVLGTHWDHGDGGVDGK